MYSEKDIFQMITLITLFTSALPLIMGFLRFGLLTDLQFRILFYSFISFTFDLIGKILWWNSLHNLWLYNIYTFFEFLAVGLIYQSELKQYTGRKVYIGFMGLVILFFLLDLFYLQDFYLNNSYSTTLEGVIFIFWALCYFYKKAVEPQVSSLSQEPVFWFSIGLLLYFSGGLFIFIFSNYILSYSEEFGTRIWSIHGIFLLIFHLLQTRALWSNHKKGYLNGY